MFKAFKEFWRSYWDLCKASLVWMKEHWIGYIILCLVILTPYIIWYICYSRKIDKEIEELRQKERDSMDNFMNG